MKTVDITVIEAPVWVEFICPECKERIDMNYNSFCTTIVDLNKTMGNEKFKCPHCSKELKINTIIFD